MQFSSLESFLSISFATEQIITFSIIGLIILFVIGVYIHDVTQRKHTIQRNYPVIGHFRYMAEKLGVYLRQYFYSRDREELPFNRAQREWVYRAAKNLDTMQSFGSTRNIEELNTILFVDAPFPILGRNAAETRAITFGPHVKHPYQTRALINISAMSFGSISKQAILALGRGAKMAGCWMNTGEGGLTPYHLESGCDLVAQIGTAKFGYRDKEGHFCEERLRKAAAHPQVVMFEIKLSQGAKPGKGGILPGAKVNKEIAEIRGLVPYEDAISPNRHPEIANSSELLDFIKRVRDVAQKPTGIKFVLGSYEWLDEFCQEIWRRGIEHAPDFITLDGAHGGTGAAPMALMDYMGIPIGESLPILVDTLVEYDLRDRIKVIASGKLINPNRVAKALCLGADLVNSARGFMFSLGCIQAMRCHTNRCPTGITSYKKRYTKGLNIPDKAQRVYHYAMNLQHEVGVISHSCGVHEPRELSRAHARIMTDKGVSVSLAELYPEKQPGVKKEAFLKTLQS